MKIFEISVNEDIEIRLLTKLECNNFYMLMLKNRSHLVKFLPKIYENLSYASTCEFIQNFIIEFVNGNGFRGGIYYNGNLVGMFGLKYINWEQKQTEFSYWIDYEYEGLGIISLCIKKMMEICFDNLKLNEIFIKVNINNISSIRVTEKNNFIRITELIGDEIIDGSVSNSYLYSIKSNFN